MSEPFVAEIHIFGFNFAPVGWATCDGQILPISQNTALFSLIGTYYGGNGTSNFALPNLQGCAPMGMGSGAGLTSRTLGETGGENSVALNVTNLPAHNHVAKCSDQVGDQYAPAGFYWSQDAGGNPEYDSNGSALMNAGAIGTAGGSAPHNNLQPSLTLNFCIALQGVYPARS